MTQEKQSAASATPRWGKVRDAAAFMLGTFILLWQTVAEDSPSVILAVIALACLGVTGSGVAQRAIERVIGDGK